jgi:hypothetical protein
MSLDPEESLDFVESSTEIQNNSYEACSEACSEYDVYNSENEFNASRPRSDEIYEISDFELSAGLRKLKKQTNSDKGSDDEKDHGAGDDDYQSSEEEDEKLEDEIDDEEYDMVERIKNLKFGKLTKLFLTCAGTYSVLLIISIFLWS